MTDDNTISLEFSEEENENYAAIFIPSTRTIHVYLDQLGIDAGFMLQDYLGKSYDECKAMDNFKLISPDTVALIKATRNDDSKQFITQFIQVLIYHEMRHAYQNKWVQVNSYMEMIGSSPRHPKHWKMWRRELTVTGKDRWLEADANAFVVALICPDMTEEEVGTDVYKLLQEYRAG